MIWSMESKVVLTESQSFSILGSIMPNTSSAKKELRKSEKRKIANLRIKTHIKSLSKQLKESIRDGKVTEAKELSKKIQQATAKASMQNIIHLNKATRLTARAVKLANKK